MARENFGPHASFGTIPELVSCKPNDLQNVTFVGSSHTLGPSHYLLQNYQSRMSQSQQIIRGRNYYPPAHSTETSNRPAHAYHPNVHPGFCKAEVQIFQKPPPRIPIHGDGTRNHHHHHHRVVHNNHTQSNMVAMPLRLLEAPSPSLQLHPHFSAPMSGNMMWNSSSAVRPSLNSILHESSYPSSMAPPMLTQKRKYPSPTQLNVPISSNGSWGQLDCTMMMTMMHKNDLSDGDRLKRPKLSGQSFLEVHGPNPMGPLVSHEKKDNGKSNRRIKTSNLSIKVQDYRVDPYPIEKSTVTRNQDDGHSLDSSKRELEVIAANILCSFSKIHDSTTLFEEDKGALVSPDASTDNLFQSHDQEGNKDGVYGRITYHMMPRVKCLDSINEPHFEHDQYPHCMIRP